MLLCSHTYDLLNEEYGGRWEVGGGVENNAQTKIRPKWYLDDFYHFVVEREPQQSVEYVAI